MSGPDCIWCGMTIGAHRESGPVAKTPCGMLKRGFVAAKPPTQIVDLSEAFQQTSVGDVPAPKRQHHHLSFHESRTAQDATSVERAAVVKYLRGFTETDDAVVKAMFRFAAAMIEKGEHVK